MDEAETTTLSESLRALQLDTMSASTFRETGKKVSFDHDKTAS